MEGIRYFISQVVNGIRVENGKPALFIHEEYSNHTQRHAQHLLDSGLWEKENLSDEEAHYNQYRNEEYAENIAIVEKDPCISLEFTVKTMITDILMQSEKHKNNILGDFLYLGTEIACNHRGIVLVQRFFK